MKRVVSIISTLVLLSNSMVHAHALYNEKNEGTGVVKVAINGFGRIGRNFVRGVFTHPIARKHIEIVAINIGPAKKEFAAHMFKYDTLMGTFAHDVSMSGNNLLIDDYAIEILTECDPTKAPWGRMDIDWVIECTGRFTTREGAQKHLDAGAKHVLISAPAKGDDISIVPGINQDLFNADKHKIVSLGSCTTNAFLPTIKVLDEKFGITRGFMTTIHSYTNNQVLLDVETDDLRRSRAAALNIIPTSTGAAKMIPRIMPHLGDCIAAISVRVPVGKVSLIDFAFETKKQMTVEEICNAFDEAAQANLSGILGTTYEPLVSSDFGGSDYSVTIDQSLTQVNGNSAKVFGWYDNEWGYSMRLRDFLIFVAQNK